MDGSEYQGEFKNGKKNGEGIMKFPKGQVYKGGWNDGVAFGKGSFE